MKKFKSFILIFLSVTMIIGSIFACGAFICLNKLTERTEHLDFDLSRFKGGIATLYYYDFKDRENRIGVPQKLDTELYGGGYRHIYTEYSDIPTELINAFIAIEDKHFFKHNGVDLPRTAMAVANYVFKGERRFGASTITQQLIKNLTGNNEISVSRKLNEIFAALNLEKRLDKTEIITMYLNIINLSDGCFGVGAASEHYFSKPMCELSVAEAATLAAITNNPSYYNPRLHPENTKIRRDLILKCMLEQGYISNIDYENAVAEPIMLNLSDSDGSGVNSWYVDAVISDVTDALCEKYGINRESASLMIYTSGLKIYTAQDPKIQNIVDTYYSDPANFPTGIYSETPQSSMIIIDPHTGDVLALSGAIGEKNANRVQNLATDTLHPPGSCIKPLSVYAPAFESGLIKWSTQVEDSPVENGWPSNASKKYIGMTDVAYALKYSLNTVPVKLLHEIGNQKSLGFLKDKLKIGSLGDCDTGDAALALGQPTHGITLMELTSAYSIFQNGVYSKPRLYFKVTDSDGNILLDNNSEQYAVISEENAAIMTKLLEAVIEEGTARGTVSLDKYVDVAGKTGTTQNNCDKLFVGYTPMLLGGVWFGYEYPKKLEGIRGNTSAYIWNKIMTDIYASLPRYSDKLKFDVPDDVNLLSYENEDGSMSYGWFQTD